MNLGKLLRNFLENDHCSFLENVGVCDITWIQSGCSS